MQQNKNQPIAIGSLVASHKVSYTYVARHPYPVLLTEVLQNKEFPCCDYMNKMARYTVGRQAYKNKFKHRQPRCIPCTVGQTYKVYVKQLNVSKVRTIAIVRVRGVRRPRLKFTLT